MSAAALEVKDHRLLASLTGGWQHSESANKPVTVPTPHASHPLRQREHNGDAIAARAW